MILTSRNLEDVRTLPKGQLAANGMRIAIPKTDRVLAIAEHLVCEGRSLKIESQAELPAHFYNRMDGDMICYTTA